MTVMMAWLLLVCSLLFCHSFLAFLPTNPYPVTGYSLTKLRRVLTSPTSRSLSQSDNPINEVPSAEQKTDKGPINKKKGFGKVVEPVKPEPDIGSVTYDRQAKRGVPEYNIFLRPKNGTDAEWLPVGSMTIPRDMEVGKAVLEVEAKLIEGTFKLYPKLKSFYGTKVSRGDEVFEYGYCLKAFPDEEIVLIQRQAPEDDNFFTNWLSKITNPIDLSSLKNRGQMTLKQ